MHNERNDNTLFVPFIGDGFISSNEDINNAKPIKILRDTGASQSLVLSSVLPLQIQDFTQPNTITLKGLGTDPVHVFLREVFLLSTVYTGWVNVGITETLPIPGVQMLLGNDIAGHRVTFASDPKQFDSIYHEGAISTAPKQTDTTAHEITNATHPKQLMNTGPTMTNILDPSRVESTSISVNSAREPEQSDIACKHMTNDTFPKYAECTNAVPTEKADLTAEPFDLPQSEHAQILPTAAVTRSMTTQKNAITTVEYNEEDGNILQSSAQKHGEHDCLPGSGENDGGENEHLDLVTGVGTTKSNNSFKSSEDTPFVDLSESIYTQLTLESNDNESVRQQFMREQRRDTELNGYFDRVVEKERAGEEPVCFYVDDGVLVRHWSPPHTSPGQEWKVKKQIVVPRPYRPQIMSMAHDLPIAGHLGIRKTFVRITNEFWWPSVKRDIANYCKRCHVCQLAGKPNQPIPKAPLQPIPVYDEPFSRIIIDCVGPLPKTKGGNAYLLTMMCQTSRFTEAIPLRNIKTQTIVKALIKFFTWVGLPKVIQCDQGSNFTSNLFQQVLAELGVSQIHSSAYHPESQGALERFHQTLKSMLRKFCIEHHKEWDESIPMLMFAARESHQEALGFSPFEIVYGHTVRGPLKAFKEGLLSENNASPLLNYVLQFREKLNDVVMFARDNLEKSQTQMKNNYDTHSKERTFQVNDKVLVLLPQSDPLDARYSGPYDIVEKVSELNYVIRTPDRRKKKQLVHINLIKRYHEPNQELPLSSDINQKNCNFSDTLPCDDESDCDNECEIVLPPEPVNDNSAICINAPSSPASTEDQGLNQDLQHLSQEQQHQLTQLLLSFSGLFGGSPSMTDKTTHDINLSSTTPIHQHGYRLSPTKRAILKEEIEKLLEAKIIKPSRSPWSSPCLLVPKSDGTHRLVVDFRKINNITIPDRYPMPRIDDLIDTVASAKYISKLDLVKGYHQIPLEEDSKEVTAFVTPFGLYEYNAMPFGLMNAPATFQRLMNNVLAGIENVVVYLDDIVVFSDSWEDHLHRLEVVLARLRDANLTVNPKKCDFAGRYVTYLGHSVGNGSVSPVDIKIEPIMEFPTPKDKKQLMRFLGMTGYYRRFCENYAETTVVLTNLLKKGSKYEWTNECQNAFEKLKSLLINAPVLAAPKEDQPWSLVVDASHHAAGAVLQQMGNDGFEHPVAYFSKKFNPAQINYSTIEKECLALVMATTHFSPYLPTSEPITVFCDHNPLVFLKKMTNSNQRLTRWALFLQQYNLEIRHIPGRDNVLADSLSRM